MRDFVTKYIDHNVVKRFLCENYIILLFLFFVLFYLSFGIYITYFNPLVTQQYVDLIYDLDIGKNFGWFYLDTSIPTLKHYLSNIMLTPITHVLSSFMTSPKLTVVFLQSVIQSLSVCLILKSMILLTNKKYLSIMLASVFGFGYGTVMMAIFPELYVWAGFFQSLFIYYVINILKNEKEGINVKNVVVLSMFSTFSCGINTINIASSIVLVMLVLTYIYKSKKWSGIKDFIKILVLVIAIIFFIGKFQSFELNNKKWSVGIVRYSYKSSYARTFEGTFVEPLYALKSSPGLKKLTVIKKVDNKNIKIKRRMKHFFTLKKQNPTRYIPALLFLLFPLFFYKKQSELYKKYVLISFSTIVLMYTVFNFVFCNNQCALFAMNYFPFLIILLGLLYEKVPNLYRNIIVGGFLCYIIPQNIHYLFKIQRFVHSPADKFHSYGECMLYALLFTIIVGASIYVCKKIMDKYKCCALSVEENYFVYTLLYLGFILVFGVFHAFSIYKV